MLKGLKSNQSKNYSNVSLPAKMEKIYGMHKLVGLQLFRSRTPTFSSGTPTFCQMGVLNSCFQNPSESSDNSSITRTKVGGTVCKCCKCPDNGVKVVFNRTRP